MSQRRIIFLSETETAANNSDLNQQHSGHVQASLSRITHAKETKILLLYERLCWRTCCRCHDQVRRVALASPHHHCLLWSIYVVELQRITNIHQPLANEQSIYQQTRVSV